MCLSIYLERSGINKSEEVCTFRIPQDSTDFDTLSALTLATWVTKTQRLECRFEGRDGNLTVMLAQLARLQALLDRFTSLGTVILDFNPQDKPYLDLSYDDMVNWSDAMGNLLSRVVERRCTTLEVNGLGQMCDVYHGMLRFLRKPRTPSGQPLSLFDATINGVAKLFSAMPPRRAPERSRFDDTILWGPTWDYRRDETKSTTQFRDQFEKILARLSDTAEANSNLTQLTIGSKSMLCPPLLQWTYSALESSPISTLIIRDVDFVGPTWSLLSVLFPQAIPSLERLELSRVGTISPDQTTGFMAAFSKLKYLSLSGVDLPWYTALSGSGSATTAPRVLSPCLEEFRVQANWIVPTMDFGAKAFPALRTLTIVFDGGLPTRIEEASPLLPLAQHRPNMQFEVVLEIRASNDITSWMRRTKAADVAQLADVFQCVSGLVLVVKERLEFEHEPSKEAVREAAEKWFGQFPALREAGIRTEVGNLIVEIPRIQKFCKRALPGVARTLRRFHVNGQAFGPHEL
jgi:hypothetical protein